MYGSPIDAACDRPYQLYTAFLQLTVIYPASHDGQLCSCATCARNVERRKHVGPEKFKGRHGSSLLAPLHRVYSVNLSGRLSTSFCAELVNMYTLLNANGTVTRAPSRLRQPGWYPSRSLAAQDSDSVVGSA